jgi:hypothetical protein
MQVVVLSADGMFKLSRSNRKSLSLFKLPSAAQISNAVSNQSDLEIAPLTPSTAKLASAALEIGEHSSPVIQHLTYRSLGKFGIVFQVMEINPPPLRPPVVVLPE